MIDLATEEGLLSAFAWICFGAWRALPLLGIVLVIDLTLSRRIAARYHCMLWMIVAAGMMCPVSVESSFSMRGRIESLHESIGFSNEQVAAIDHPPYEAVDDPRYDAFTFQNDDGQSRTILLMSLPENATDEQRAAADAFAASESKRIKEQPASTDPDLSARYVDDSTFDATAMITYAFVGGWLVVSCFLIARGGIQSLRFALRLRRCSTVNEQVVIDLVLRVCDALRVGRRPKIKEVEGLDVPAVFGVWRPTICLPVDATSQLSGEELRLILMHEVAHVKRRDGLVLSLAILMRSLHWFNPLAWLVVSRLRNYMEQAADDVALRSAPEQTLTDYGRLLLRFASQGNSIVAPAAIGLLFSSPGRTLGHRIAMLGFNRHRNHWLAQAIALALVVTLAVGGLTDAKTDEAEPHGGVSVPEASFSVGPPAPFNQADLPVTTKTYDATSAIAKIRDTEPERDAEQRLLSQFDSVAVSLGDGILTLTGTEPMHQQVQESIAAMEQSGYWETTYQVWIGLADIERAAAGVIDWTTDAVLPLRGDSEFGSLPLPATTTPTASDDRKTDQLSIELHREAGTWRTLLGVKITEDQATRFITRCEEDSRTSVFNAPKATLYNGRTGHIVDESQRPFVTGLRPFIENGARGVEPIIDVLPEGTRLTFRGTVTEEERLSMQLMLTLSAIGDVMLAHLPFPMPTDANLKATVQVPRATSISATASTTLSRGESLLMVAPTSFAADQPQKRSKAMFYLVSPEWQRSK